MAWECGDGMCEEVATWHGSVGMACVRECGDGMCEEVATWHGSVHGDGMCGGVHDMHGNSWDGMCEGVQGGLTSLLCCGYPLVVMLTCYMYPLELVVNSCVAFTFIWVL